MKQFRLLPILMGVFLFLVIACNDATVIGSDLILGEELDAEFTDTVSFTTYNRVIDTVTLYNPDAGVVFANLPFGDFEDPVFGRSTSSIYSQVTLAVSGAPDFEGFVKDSVILILPFNPSAFYGDTTETYSLEVYEIGESLEAGTNFNSSLEFALGEKLGEASFVPSSADVAVIDPTDGELDSIGAHLRVKLEGDIIDSLFSGDPSKFDSTDDFEDFFHGFHLKPTSVNAGMVGFNLRRISPTAGITVYYSNVAGDEFFDYQFSIFNSQVVTANFQQEYGGSIAEPFLGEGAEGRDSLLFIQSMAGINVSFEFPHLEALGDIIINEAILELPIVDIAGDSDALFDPIQLIAIEINEDGLTKLIDDVTFASGSDVGTLFGGIPENGVYQMNISSFLQDAKQGTINNTLEVLVLLKPEKAERVVLAGPAHSTTPAKLKLTYTEF